MKSFKITQKDFEKLTAPTIESAYEDQEQTEEESEKKKKLKEELSRYQDTYESTPYRTYSGIVIPNAVEKEYVAPSDEETKAKVSETVQPLYDAKMQSAKDDSEMAQRQKSDEIDLIYERAKDSLKTMAESYDKSKEDLSDEAVKRGLSRSSIIASQLDELEKAKNDAEMAILNKRDSDVGKIDREINDLKTKLYNKIAEINGEKSVDIDDRTDALIKEYAKEQSDVLEYNNALRQQKASLIAEAMSKGIDISETSSDEYIKMIADKTKSIYAYYYSFGKNALSEMQKDRSFIEEQLGNDGYETLVKYFK